MESMYLDVMFHEDVNSTLVKDRSIKSEYHPEKVFKYVEAD